jgi:hypothetical protein
MADSFTQAKENTIKAGIRYANAKKRELRGQGHKATGNLIKSIKPVVKFKFELPLHIDIMALDYGDIIDKGLKKGTKVPIPVLIEWIKRTDRGLKAKERLSKAFGVRTNIEKFGSPTPNAFRFSKNGRRLDWKTATNEKDIASFIRGLKMRKVLAERIREIFREKGFDVIR